MEQRAHDVLVVLASVSREVRRLQRVLEPVDGEPAVVARLDGVLLMRQVLGPEASNAAAAELGFT
ncbi:MAG: hypothetical protein ACK5CE_03590 [Actinomycetes bacterium]